MKDVTKAPASRKGSKRTVQQGPLQEVELPQTAVQQTAAQQIADKTTGASNRAPRRSAAQREAEEADGLSREADTIGIDVGDRVSQFCRLDASGEIAEQGKLHTNAAGFEKHFAKLPQAVIALEAGTQSGWIARLLRRFGHKVTVANPRELAAITSSSKKSDRNDAEKLARLARADLRLLRPTYVRSVESARDGIALRSRDGFVRSRTLLVNLARSLAKMEGERLPATISKSFGERALKVLPVELASRMELLLRMIDFLSMAIEEAAEDIGKLLRTKYPEARKLMKVPGVGPITALSFVLELGDPGRFQNSRDVGAFLGMTPASRQSGDRDPELGITKAGNGNLRRLLVQCAHYTLGHFGEDSALRQWGQKLVQRGGANANKRAIVAVARKLSVILHKLWRTGEDYKPFPATS
jgi:transposase